MLIAPSDEVACFVASAYCFDSVHVEPVKVIRQPDRLNAMAGDLRVDLVVGRRGLLGVLLARNGSRTMSDVLPPVRFGLRLGARRRCAQTPGPLGQITLVG